MRRKIDAVTQEDIDALLAHHKVLSDRSCLAWQSAVRHQSLGSSIIRNIERVQRDLNALHHNLINLKVST